MNQGIMEDYGFITPLYAACKKENLEIIKLLFVGV